jgi:hypothetical protein
MRSVDRPAAATFDKIRKLRTALEAVRRETFALESKMTSYEKWRKDALARIEELERSIASESYSSESESYSVDESSYSLIEESSSDEPYKPDVEALKKKQQTRAVPPSKSPGRVPLPLPIFRPPTPIFRPPPQLPYPIQVPYPLQLPQPRQPPQPPLSQPPLPQPRQPPLSQPLQFGPPIFQGSPTVEQVRLLIQRCPQLNNKPKPP